MLPSDFDIFSPVSRSIPLCIHTRAKRSPAPPPTGRARSRGAGRSGRARRRGRQNPPAELRTSRMASLDVPAGRPRPQGESQAVSSSGFVAFQSAKSSGERLPSPGSTRAATSSIRPSGPTARHRRAPDGRPRPQYTSPRSAQDAPPSSTRRASDRRSRGSSRWRRLCVGRRAGASVSARWRQPSGPAGCAEHAPLRHTPGRSVIHPVMAIPSRARPRPGSGYLLPFFSTIAASYRRVVPVDAPMGSRTAAVDPQRAGRARIGVDSRVSPAAGHGATTGGVGVVMSAAFEASARQHRDRPRAEGRAALAVRRFSEV